MLLLWIISMILAIAAVLYYTITVGVAIIVMTIITIIFWIIDILF